VAESIHEQIAAAIQTSLAAIVSDGGTTYWYTPGAVVRTLWFSDEEGDLNLLQEEIGGAIYAIRPGDETHEEGTTGQMRAEADIFILVAMPFTDPETPFANAVPSRWTVVNRMVRDVLRKLLVDVRLLSAGGAVENIFASPVIVDRDRFVEGWAIAEIQMQVSYHYALGVP
jgi:hypothetical protein